MTLLGVTAPTVVGRVPGLQQLGRALREVGFTAPQLRRVLGAGEGALVNRAERPARIRRLAESTDPVAALATLFVLGDPYDAQVAELRLGALAEQLVTYELADEIEGVLRPRVRLVPHDEILIASDHVDGDLPSDHVAGVHRPSHLLASLTLRVPVARALDMGTGNGIQAILLSRHAERVVATDVNERALQFAELNAALNGIDNVEFRTGSLLDPVAGEQFGVIATNPPYVISPALDLVFRDSGMGGDAISEQVVRGLPAVIAEDGYATVLVSWDATGGEPAQRPIGWLEGSDCQAWILHTGLEAAIESASRWTADATDRSAEFERWLVNFEARGIELVGYGAVILHRGGPPWVRSGAIPPAPVPATAHLRRMFAAPTRALLPSDRVRMADATRIVVTYGPDTTGYETRGIELRVTDGVGFAADLDGDAAAIAQRLGVAQSVADLALGEDGLAFVDRLLQFGFAELV